MPHSACFTPHHRPGKSLKYPIFCSLRSLLQSVLAAFFGVQSERKRQQDFNSRSVWPYLLTAVVMTLILVFLLVLAARFLAG